MHYAARCRSPLPHLSSRIAIRLASFTWAGRHELDHASLDWMPCDEVGPLRALGGIWLIGHPSVIRTFRTFWGFRLRRVNKFRGVHLTCLQCVPKPQLISDRGALKSSQNLSKKSLIWILDYPLARYFLGSKRGGSSEPLTHLVRKVSSGRQMFSDQNF